MDLISNASTVLFIPDDLYCYRNNPGSILHKERTAARYKIDFTSAFFVVDLMTSKPYFSNKDIEEQAIDNTHELAIKLEEISNLKTSFAKKKEILDNIKNEPYFINYIQKYGVPALSGKEHEMFELFLKDDYKKLIRKERIAYFPKRIKHLISVIL